VFSKGSVYDQDDREADKVWDDVDDAMDQRRRAPREKRLREELEEMRKSNPKITETFADLKRDLAETMTAEDWEVRLSVSIPCSRATCRAYTRQSFAPKLGGGAKVIYDARRGGGLAGREVVWVERESR